MLKNFWSAGGDNVTPKASASDKNPFDALGAAASRPAAGSRKNSAASGIYPPPTPTGKSFGLPFFAGSSNGSTRGSNGSDGSRLARTPADDLATPGPSNYNPSAAAATIQLSRAEPDFTLKSDSSLLAKRRAAQQPQNLEAQPPPGPPQPPPVTTPAVASAPASGSSTPNTAAARGKLSVKVIQARNLAVASESARPYVVAAYDQNEFVGREMVMDTEASVTHYISAKGTQTPMSSSPPKSASGTAIIGSANNNMASKGAQGALARSLEAHRNGAGSPTPQHQKQGSTGSTMGSTISAHNPVWKQEVIFDVVNEAPNPIRISIYDRVHDEGFLGAVDILPRLSLSSTVDTWIKLQARGEEKITGEIRLQYRYEKLDGKKSLSVKDFDFLRMIGKGTFGRVFQVRKKDTKRIYAMKVLSKREIVAKKEVAHTIGERKILQRSSECPFLLGLKFSFQNATELYLVMDYKSGGELFHHLQQEGRFTEDRARFYTAEIVLAFEHLHKYDIVYRDLKPENILLDATGHIVLCDFGLSKPDLPSDALTNTFCGTTEYLAPEVLLDDHGYSKLVDFWSLGVLLFEMCCGWSPFYAEDTQQMYKNICFGKIKFPRGVIGDDGKQFVKGLLNRNPRHRLGAHRDAGELKEHAFFSSIDWTALAAREIVPPFMPFVESDESVANFDAEFTSVKIQDAAPRAAVFDDSDTSAAWIEQASSVNSAGVPIREARRQESHPLSHSVQDAFQGFSYAGSPPSWANFTTSEPRPMSEDEQM